MEDWSKKPLVLLRPFLINLQSIALVVYQPHKSQT